MTGRSIAGAACVAAVAALLASIRAAGEEPCLPLTRTSLERATRTFALDADQARWLLDTWAAGRLSEPGDLEGWPGTGPELRDEVAAALCWDAAPSGHAVAGTVARMGFVERRGALFWESRFATARMRVREQSTTPAPLIRGGGTLRNGSWTLAGGTLEGRRALGLVLETAGAESRGTAPRVHSSRRFEVTLGSDPWTPIGGAVGLARGAWALDLAALRVGGLQSPVGVGVLERHGGSGRMTFCALGGAPGDGAASLALARGGGSGDWALELARGGRGYAAAFATSGAVESWRIRGSLAWRGRGYASPLARGSERPLSEAGVHLSAEVRWSDGDGRSLRISRGEERGPDSWGFTLRSIQTEVEAEERLARGLEAAILWRGRNHRNSEAGGPEETSQEARAEVRFTRSPHQARIRVDERLDRAGSRALHVVLARSRGHWRWELRAVRSHPGPGTAAPRVYFRRAGDVVGWTTARPGTSLGAWVAWSWKGWTLEGSGDGGAGLWTWTLGLRRGFGGAP